MSGVRIAVLTVLAVGGTSDLGGGTRLSVGVLRGLPLLPRRGTIVEAAAGGVLGWVVLLAWSALNGPVWRVARDVGPIFRVPAWAMPVTMLVFAALAAGAAATVTGLVTRRR